MKTLLTSIILLLLNLIAYGQSQPSDHLAFKGVPINGTLGEYVAKMKENGFIQIGAKEETVILKGDFAGYKGCTVGVSTLKQKDLVNKITVTFPRCENWSALYANYTNLKEMLVEKYGKPFDVVEKFVNYNGNTIDDNSKMHEVKFDNCKYYSVFKTEKGSIELSIDHDNFLNCFAKLIYLDKINSEIIKAKAIGDL